MKFKKGLCLLLAAIMMMGMLAACQETNPTTNSASKPSNGDDPVGPVIETFEGDFIYKDAVVQLSANWNPHTYQTSDQSYPLDFITDGLYTFMYNDEFHPVEGKDAFEGYAIVPTMAEGMLVDVTEQIAAEHPEFGIPEGMTSGYAYTVKLNPNVKFDNGKPINAETYVESMKRLLAPGVNNYRSEIVRTGDFVLANAEAYQFQGSNEYAALGITVADWLAEGNSIDDLYINISAWYNIKTAKGEDWAKATDETLIRDPSVDEGEEGDWISPKQIYDAYFAPESPYSAVYSAEYCGKVVSEYPEMAWENVGIFASGEYELTFVLQNSLSGFYLYYNVGSLCLPLVDIELYDSCLTEKDGVYTSTYCTSVETTVGYGPYKLAEYQMDKSMRFVRNESWYGYTDGKHVYQDPENGKNYPMYQTTEIQTQVVAEADTQKLMFLAGELMGYGLQAADFEQYRSSEFVHATPATSIFFLILNGHTKSIADREAAEGFDKASTDLESMTLLNFRKAMAVAFDKELFASTVSPSRSGAYGVIGNLYVYDVDSGARYRDTDQAKQILCDVYSVDVSKYDSLDEAVKSITGYDPVAANKLFNDAFAEALDKGYITDSNNDGISDQTVEITYAISADSQFMTTTIDYLNEKLDEVTAGTGFDGKIKIVKSAALGDAWSDRIKDGSVDTVLGGWKGSALNPFSLTDLYTNPQKAYDAKWFDATTVELTLNVNVAGPDAKEMKDVTMTLKQWSDALNGTATEVNGVIYNFGDGQTDIDTRLTILAGIEGEVLRTYNYLPMLQDASMALLSQQVYYVVEDYSPVMGRGGIAYMKYNYNEVEWEAFIAEQGGELEY